MADAGAEWEFFWHDLRRRSERRWRSLPAYSAGKSAHGLQFLRAQRLLKENPSPSEAEIRMGISGNFCRCTGYQNIVLSIAAGAKAMANSDLA